MTQVKERFLLIVLIHPHLLIILLTHIGIGVVECWAPSGVDMEVGLPW